MNEGLNLSGISFRGESRQRLKSLADYPKGTKLPDRFGSSFNRQLAEIAKPEVQADIENHFSLFRQKFEYKRKDVRVSEFQEGGIWISTPDFEYGVRVEGDEADPSSVIWRREVTKVREPSLLESEAFQSVFSDRFDTLVFTFEAPADLEALIDSIEERDPEGIKVDYPSDCSWCEITLSGQPVVIRVVRDGLEIQSRAHLTSAELFRIFRKFEDSFRPANRVANR